MRKVPEMDLNQKIDAAFLKASYRVLEVAKQKMTKVAIVRDNEVVLVEPDEIHLPEIDFILDMPKDHN